MGEASKSAQVSWVLKNTHTHTHRHTQTHTHTHTHTRPAVPNLRIRTNTCGTCIECSTFRIQAVIPVTVTILNAQMTVRKDTHRPHNVRLNITSRVTLHSNTWWSRNCNRLLVGLQLSVFSCLHFKVAA